MGFIEKLKLLFKVRQPATDLINEVRQVKSGWKTLPFWIALIGTLLALTGSLTGFMPPLYALVITTVLTALYNILRGATKANSMQTKPILQTTEFWLSVGGQIAIALSSLKTGGIDTKWVETAASVVGATLAAGQNLAAQQPNAPPLPVTTTNK